MLWYTRKREMLGFSTTRFGRPRPYIALDSKQVLYIVGTAICLDFLCLMSLTMVYVDADIIDEDVEAKMQELFDKKTVVFHNAKFDLQWFRYHFNFKFPNFEDTMLMHYMFDEQPGTHGLKQLAMKHTPYGDYEKPLEDWGGTRKQHGILNNHLVMI